MKTKLLARLALFVTSVMTTVAVYAASDTVGRISRLRECADSLHNAGRTDSAVVVGAQAVELARESGIPVQIVGTLSSQGVFLRSLGRIDDALDAYGKALEIVTSREFRDNPDSEAVEETASLYINLAVLNLDMQHKDEAVKNAVLSADWVAKSDDAQLRSTIYGVVGSVMTGCGESERALRYQTLAYDDALKAGDTEAAFRASAYIMLIEDRLGHRSEASAWRRKCQEMLPDVPSMMARLVYYQAECSICLSHDDQRGAIEYFDKILSLDGIDNLPFVVFDCYNNMHIAYAGLGDYRNAYETLLKSNALRDSIWEQEKAESLRELTVKYDTKEKELALAKSEAARSDMLMWLFVALAALSLMAVTFVVYASRQRRRRMQREMEFTALRADTERQMMQQYVEGLENERSRMARELHDGVCSDLLAIEMGMRDGKTSDASSMIASCRESVRRISHELMPPEFAYATIDEVIRFFVHKQAAANGSKMTLTYESEPAAADWGTVRDDVALEVYRIAQEAVSNAVSHSGASNIAVTMRLDGGTLTLTVADDGTYRQNVRKGYGLESMRRRAAAINGSIDIRRSDDDRTVVTMTVKL